MSQSTRIPKSRPLNLIALQQWCDERGLLSVQLAKKAEISQSYMSEIMLGKKNPSVRVAKKIADALGIDVRTIFYPRSQSTAIAPESIRAS